MGRSSSSRSADRFLNVGLLIEVSSAHGRGLIRGISEYSQERGPWRLHLVEQVRAADLRRWLDTCPCDGLIARVETPQIAAVLAERKLPVVNVAGTSTPAPCWHVDTDNQAVCALAVGHLVDRGYAELAFCGMTQCEWSRWRKDFFIAELAKQGLTCSELDLPSLTADTRLTLKERRTLLRWLNGLPKPVGILAANDHCGRVLLEACDEAQLAVPGEIGVLGVDNDEMVCQLCWPPLSSIETNSERIGYVAAEALGRLLGSSDSPSSSDVETVLPERLVKPVILISRRSTDAAAVREPIVAEALRFIREHACEEVYALDVAKHVSVSRRYLEQRFRQVIRRSIHMEVQRVRLETAQRLLAETDWKLQTIAERSGFKQAAHMSAVFFDKLRLRPGQYRQQIQSRWS